MAIYLTERLLVMSRPKESEAHHEELIEAFRNQLKPVFESSEQAMYLYLDDAHKVCNERYASLLGYGTSREWARVTEFTDLVAEKSTDTLVTAYQRAMERKIGSTIAVTWKKKSGGTVDTNVIVVPVAYNGHLFALHFVSPKV
jgi:rhamnose utilization protein RhaD (predicted bifunctional aldolase and dehydrogenase)